MGVENAAAAPGAIFGEDAIRNCRVSGAENPATLAAVGVVSREVAVDDAQRPKEGFNPGAVAAVRGADAVGDGQPGGVVNPASAIAWAEWYRAV
jgi:hypothetical protein